MKKQSLIGFFSDCPAQLQIAASSSFKTISRQDRVVSPTFLPSAALNRLTLWMYKTKKNNLAFVI